MEVIWSELSEITLLNLHLQVQGDNKYDIESKTEAKSSEKLVQHVRHRHGPLAH